jgi:hypothetical protein
MKELRFICAQPATTYYAWQVEVMINNFIEMGINPNMMDIVCYIESYDIPEAWIKLKENYSARFFFYQDTRETKHYISSIRPNILKHHFIRNSHLEKEAIFYHDCDILFTKPINWEQYLNDDIWYGSDTRWYISHDYIISKGEDVLDKMCDIVKIDKQIIKDNELNSIGAQYLMKNVSWKFWENVEKDSEQLFKQITDLNETKIIEDRRTMPPGEERTPYHPLQIWCADMWAVLWNSWKMGNQTICHKDLDFAWATSSIFELKNFNILHNAGVVNNNTNMFYKSDYMNEYPYNKKLDILPHTCSYYYWQEVCKTAKKSVLL